ncbi:DNA-binding MarR family transcriptional regulator [Diaminobutyricimonas aerilata]|uniref:DNA-binding MarR family transcriptional regulator n=1 Tax=Diaminobutyricimonas aerilata TaxID=1162967 RepID=A0A2M9CNR9_9MICO|nr:MarR family transcriptional regulator [Diaminobutyricimonas aerilata]PJJ73536.1 DNA-binding MarR family transcriptional regulator [Diaminobutyricimonas aerilata]
MVQSDVVERWRSLQTTYLSTASALERALDEKCDLGLSEFEVLDLVAESNSDQQCLMRDLVARTPMTQSALSRIVDRLQKAELVEREECGFDRRSMFVHVTAKGSAVHAEAQRVYRSLLTHELD